MEDDKIIALYWARKEEAISETDRKYGSYCRSISFRILNAKEDIPGTRFPPGNRNFWRDFWEK